ncbi:MAG: hypothetical protein OSA37_02510 [Flavobacteriales bacterium]|nr:hypothetical protein [Flavobacteriales bacterium]
MRLNEKNDESRQRVWVAISLTLFFHFVVLLALWVQPLHGNSTPESQYVEVGFDVPETGETLQEHSLEELLFQRMNREVANLVSDASKSTSSDRQSSMAEPDAMAAEVEAELRAMEQAEFERLAAEKKDFGLEGVPDDGKRDQVQTLSEWDRRFEGQVTVEFDLPGRDQLLLDVPGYRCQGGGMVVLNIEVAGDGSIDLADLAGVQVSPGNGQGVQECLVEEALKSARRSKFRASKGGTTSGTLTFRFIAQQ